MKLSVLLFTTCFHVASSFVPASYTLAISKIHRGGERLPPSATTTTTFHQTTSSSTENNKDLTVPTLPGWDPTNWTPKAFHNSPLARSAAILLTLALVGFSGKVPLTRLSSKAVATVHLLTFSTWFGTVVYTTFVAGITMFQNLPRQTFGKLQAKLFPKYFSLCSICVLLQLVTLRALPALGQKAVIALGIGLGGTLLNQFILEPRSSKIMHDRYHLEELPGGKESENYKKLAKSFGKYHGISSLINLIALCAAIAHGTYLAGALVA